MKHKPLIPAYPFIEPVPGDVGYNETAEKEIKTRMRNGVHDERTARVFRRGVFVGYARMGSIQRGITI